MGLTVRQLLDTISSKELTEWEAFYQVEPYGPAAQNYNAGLMAHYAIAPHMKKGTKPPKPEEIALGYYGPDNKVQTMDEMKDILQAMAKASRQGNGKKKKKKKHKRGAHG